jgi:hypothetical protein
MDAPTSHLILDIETIPDETIYTPEFDEQGKVKFPPIWACKVVCMGVIWMSQDLVCRKLSAIGEKTAGGAPSEGLILTEFAEFMAKKAPQIVTWNGSGFDMPVIAMRALRYGVPMRWYYAEKDYRYRYTANGHLDLADYLADFGRGRMPSLDGAAKLIGLPGKGSIKGDSVDVMWRANRYDDIRNYCLTDVIQTAFVFLRYKLHVEHIPREMYIEAATSLLKLSREDPRVAAFFAEGIDEELLLFKAKPEEAQP